MEWCRAYREDHSQGLVDKRVGVTRAKLWSVEDLVQVVRERYGVEYQSRSSYIQLLRQCGFSYQKTKKVFKSRSETKVADFEEQLEKN